ncbi:asparaginase [Methylovirgula sp. 4M-Z18]|uniref:asparaginase n=1 Tax=Methylovirgula sp. 4M-Z18 TaxID=2293567 RepID=UPI000E2FC6BC|nr:asparaginase [Methylovirgula sp. 4M-Z18]RFB81330.1 asparaginase [Methylovirgula sp. 4M-Z18]
MENPVLVEVTRGDRVESRHRGAIAVSDASGRLLLALGDVEAAIFPRSAVKALQALPLLESGAADQYGLSAAEIALAVASHSGEPVHAETSAAMLAKAGRDPACLECGVQWPMNEAVARAMAARGEKPTALNNNCSGKHAGFVCLSCYMQEDPEGYVSPNHKVMREVKGALESVTGIVLDDAQAGTDGCSIPTYAFPLKVLAQSFAKFGTGTGFAPERAQAAARIRAAVAEHPYMVAGRNRFDTDVMSVLRAKAFTKTGAEGVFCAALPSQGLGIAIKCDDGTTRAAEMMMAAALQRFLPLSDEERLLLAPRLAPRLVNWNGIEVGAIRATEPLTGGS